MKITVVGAGYVGMAYAVLLAKNNRVLILEENIEKIDKLKKGKSPIKEKQLQDELDICFKNIQVSCYSEYTFHNEDVVFVCVPTNYDYKTKKLDTSIVDAVLTKIEKENKNACVIIKSTVPVGYTEKIQKQLNMKSIVFSPEFLREGNSFNDVKNPSRIIYGGDSEYMNRLLDLHNKIFDNSTQPLIMSSKEAESVKIFSNTYLAMRVAFFNELDNFCILNNLDASSIIKGVCLDSRIGDYYNNPSFGYGGYCLVKDCRECASLCDYNPLIKSIDISNENRKFVIIQDILKNIKHDQTIGIYGLVFKKNSANMRESAIPNLIEALKKAGINVIIYEPIKNADEFLNCRVVKDFNEFVAKSNVIVANRWDKQIVNNSKVYTRDIYNRD